MYFDTGFLAAGLLIFWQTCPPSTKASALCWVDWSALSIPVYLGHYHRLLPKASDFRFTEEAVGTRTAGKVTTLRCVLLTLFSVCWQVCYTFSATCNGVDGSAALYKTYPPDGFFSHGSSTCEVLKSWQKQARDSFMKFRTTLLQTCQRSKATRTSL